MTNQDITNTANNGINPEEYFAGLGNKFAAIAVKTLFRVPAGETVIVASGFFEEEITLEKLSWVYADEMGRQKLLTSLDGLDLIPLSNVRKMSLPAGVECQIIRKGDTYVNVLGIEEEAPRDGRTFFLSKEVLGSVESANGISGAGQEQNDALELFGGLASELLSVFGLEPQDGYTFLAEELYQLYFGDGKPEGIVLAKNGKPFEAAMVPTDVTLRFVNEGDHTVKTGDVAYVNTHDVDGITVEPVYCFVERYAPLA